MTLDANAPALQQAATWFARLQDGATEADWLAFVQWLESAPANQAAYDAVEAAWIGADGLPRDMSPAKAARQSSFGEAGWWAAGVGALAAVMALVFWVSGGTAPTDSPAQAFQTDAAHAQTVALGDGSKLAINRSTQVSVAFSNDRRNVALAEGEVSFDIATEKARPFYVSVGARTVHVTGTEFNVVRHAGAVIVTVRRGSVAVEESDGTVLASLSPGMQFAVADDAKAGLVSTINPDDAFAWKDGRLVYANAPLQRVSDDLSRYFGKPVRVSPDAAAISVSGVLQIDTEDAMLRRLMLFAPISAKVSADGIVLYPR